jgi:hypothetical protein
MNNLKGEQITAATLTLGEPVLVFDINRRKGEPPFEGVIAQVGRKLVTIHYGSRQSMVASFRIEGQRINDNYGHQWFRTLPQAELDGRRIAALATLREYGIMPSSTPGYTPKLKLSQLEAMALVADNPDNYPDDPA